MKTYVILDISNLFHRARYATRADATLQSGVALHIVLNSIRKVWNNFNGSHVVFALDGHSWRYDIYPKYKAQRKVKRELLSKKDKDEEAIINEIFNDFIKFVKTKTNATVLQVKNAEADDLIARWVELHPNDNHIIVSGDTDFHQLLADNVSYMMELKVKLQQKMVLSMTKEK
jgi:5'-3' exonuclease